MNVTMTWDQASRPKEQESPGRNPPIYGHLICEGNTSADQLGKKKTDFLINNARPFIYSNRKKMKLDSYLIPYKN